MNIVEIHDFCFAYPDCSSKVLDQVNMEIQEGTFSTVLGIRQKKSQGKRLDKWEMEFYRNNKKVCDLKKRYTEEEQEEIDEWKRLLRKTR